MKKSLLPLLFMLGFAFAEEGEAPPEALPPAEPEAVAEPAPETLEPDQPAQAAEEPEPAVEAQPVQEPEVQQAEAQEEQPPEQTREQAPPEEPAVQAQAPEGEPALQKEEKKKKEIAGGVADLAQKVDPDEAVAKGNFFGGVTIFLLQGSTDDDVLDIILAEVYDFDGYWLSLDAFGGYFLSDALGLGLRVGYSHKSYDIDFEVLEDITDYGAKRKYESNGFYIQPLLRNYIKILNSKTFYFFNETSINVGYSYGITHTDDGEDIERTRTKTWDIDVGINPGISIMIMKGFAFETSVGLLGLSSTVMEVEENGKTRTEFTYSLINFTINLLAIDLGLVYFF